LRNKIKDKLSKIDSNIYYGIVPDNIDNLEEWNYLVFGQEKIRKSGSSLKDLNGYWYVVIVRENFIPDSLVNDVIDKMTEIAGLRLADGEHEYNYTFKGSTNIIVEVLTLTFTKMKKRC